MKMRIPTEGNKTLIEEILTASCILLLIAGTEFMWQVKTDSCT